MTQNKSLLSTLSIAFLATVCLSAPVHAAFFLEGLEPYSMRHCDDTRRLQDVDTSVSDPVILSPAELAELEQLSRRDFRPACPVETPRPHTPGKYNPLPSK